MDEARSLISTAISTAITRTFQRDHAQFEELDYVPGPPAQRVGDDAAGHDASRVPPVPATMLRICRDSEDPDVAFTWKVESGQPPYAIIHVAPSWLREVARPGYAVLDGYPVLQILRRDQEGRPTLVLAMAVGGSYDAAIHGWRAHGLPVQKTVAWTTDGTPQLTIPADHG
jgi:hypothetical protein